MIGAAQAFLGDAVKTKGMDLGDKEAKAIRDFINDSEKPLSDYAKIIIWNSIIPSKNTIQGIVEITLMS